jgi:hypothetical protein
LFEKQSDYKSFIESDSFVTPNVSFATEENLVFYNPIEETEEPSIPNNVIKYNASEKLTGLGDDAFNTSVMSHEFVDGVGTITFNEDVTSIGDDAFLDCSSLTSITIPDSVISIGNSVFENCWNLTSITIGSGVTSIGNSAFYDCSSLTSITCYATTAPTLNNTFSSLYSNDGILYYPSGSDYSSWLSELGSNWTGQEITA